MSGFQAIRRWLRPDVSTSTLFAVAMCLALLALISIVPVIHLHQTATEADHCALCVVMHSVTPVALAVVAVVLVQLGLAAPIVVARVPVRRLESKYFTRPPPSFR